MLHYEGGSSGTFSKQKRRLLLSSQILYYRKYKHISKPILWLHQFSYLSITYYIKCNLKLDEINTLTTYDVYNYGASLQAYALQQYLINLGHQVEIINYQPDYLTRKYDYKWVNPESKLSRHALTRFVYRIMKYLQRKTTMGRKKKVFDEFNHQVLKETATKYTSCDAICQNLRNHFLFSSCFSINQQWPILRKYTASDAVCPPTARYPF